MEYDHPLDELVRADTTHQGGTEGLGCSQRSVYLNTRTREVRMRRPLLSFRTTPYLVSIGKEVECKGPSCSLRSPETGRSVDFRIAYTARCTWGNEGRMVRSLAESDPPGQILDNYLRRQLLSFAQRIEESGRDPVIEFDTLKEEADRHLKQSAERDIGLAVKPNVSPIAADELQPIAVSLSSIPARPRAFDTTLQIDCGTEIGVLIGERMRALAHRCSAQLASEMLRQAICSAVEQELTFFDVTAPTRRQNVRTVLIEAINRKLSGLGRHIRFLELKITPDPKPEETIEIEHEVDCHVRGCENRVRIRHRLILDLVDAAMFVGSGIEDLPSWVKGRLDAITRTILFESSYLDLLLRFDPDDPGEIRARLEAEIQSLGYRLKHIMTIPDLEPLSWRDQGIVLECPDREYATADSRVQVRLEIVVQGKIEELGHENLHRYLQPRSDLVEDMRAAVEAEAQKALHTVHPQTFYTEFNSSDEGDPIRQTLQERIGTMLQDQFRLARPAVVVKPAETELTRRHSFLRNGPHRVDVDIFPLRERGMHEPVTFHITFSVIAVARDGWHVFCCHRYDSPQQELERLKEEIREHARTLFAPIPFLQLSYRIPDHLLGLRDLLEHSRMSILRSFGLDIRFEQIRRSETAAERANNERLLHGIQMQLERDNDVDEMNKGHQRKKLDTLQEKDLALTNSIIALDDEERTSVRAQLAELEALVHAHPQYGQQHDTSMPQAPEDEFSFSEYQSLLMRDALQRRGLSTHGAESGQ